MPDFKQTYKNRSDAYSHFIQAGGYPVSKSKFYDDCVRLRMIQLDKSVHLADLMAYVKSELQVDPGTGRTMADEEHDRRKRDLEMRKLEAEVEAKEKAGRKDDDRWMEVVEHETQMAAFAGLVEEAFDQLTTLRLTELIYLCGGDVRKAAEFHQGLKDLIGATMTEAVREQTRSLHFDEDQDDDYGD